MSKKKTKFKIYQVISKERVEYTFKAKKTKEGAKYYLEDTGNPNKPKGKSPVIFRAVDDGNQVRIQHNKQDVNKGMLDYSSVNELYVFLKCIHKMDKNLAPKYTYMKIK